MEHCTRRGPTRLRSRSMMGALLTTTVVSVLALAPANSMAYVHTWGCYRLSADRCLDESGTNPNPWDKVRNLTEYTRQEVCAKAATLSNNTRQGSGCNYGTNFRQSDIAGSYPESVAYIYWGGSGQVTFNDGRAATNDGE